jgi:hypothetical protein
MVKMVCLFAFLFLSFILRSCQHEREDAQPHLASPAKFVYLVQVKFCEDAARWLEDLESSSREILVLVWAENYTKSKIGQCTGNTRDDRIVHFPNSTWNSGRNELFRLAQSNKLSAN